MTMTPLEKVNVTSAARDEAKIWMLLDPETRADLLATARNLAISRKLTPAERERAQLRADVLRNCFNPNWKYDATL
jgi:hypothetical protein